MRCEVVGKGKGVAVSHALGGVEEPRVRVIVADDSGVARAGLCALLGTAAGVAVVGTAADGAEAISLVEECGPDVVLIDARMPRVDGLAATRSIKARWPGIRVIVLTLSSAYRAEALAAGADGFLVKGGSPEDLVAAVLA